MRELASNIACVLSAILLVAYLGKKIVVSDNFWVSVGLALACGELYVAAKVLHISFVLLPFNGGITWEKPARLLALSFLGALGAMFFYLKDGYKSSSSKNA
jgi:hypothetical protein